MYGAYRALADLKLKNMKISDLSLEQLLAYKKAINEEIKKRKEKSLAKIEKKSLVIQQNDLDWLIHDKGVPPEIAKRELAKFVLYWTESNSAKTKQRWQLEKVFDVRRRLVTWFSRIREFNKTEEQMEVVNI